MILAIDLGTTSWKAALISPDGASVQVVRIPTPVILEDGFPCYSAHDLGGHLKELTAHLPDLSGVSLIAVTGMAEAGLATERRTGRPLSPIRPWFDRQALPLYEETRRDPRFSGRQEVTGLPDSWKYGVYKLLTFLKNSGAAPDQVTWMSLQAYAAFLMTGERAEEPGIAARTGCFDLRTRRWDNDFIISLGLDPHVFPPLIRSGTAAGTTLPDNPCGLPAGIPVCLAGHDHLCAAWGVGALQRGQAFISTGTAQVVLHAASSADPSTGLSYGPSPNSREYACIGSIQSAGGSVNFWKDRLYPGEDHAVLIREAEQAPCPSGLLYFPYLSGSGAPHLDPAASGMICGLRENTSRGEMIAAVYEGIALETRYLAEAMGISPGQSITCTGGLTLHHRYMQTLADVLGCSIHIPAVQEATLYGAARLAAQATGTAHLPDPLLLETCAPDMRMHELWSGIYHHRYQPMMALTRTEDC